MHFGPIRERKRIEHFLRRETRAHVYAIADLDDVFWGDTRWFAAFDGHDVEAICLLLDGLALPILYAVCPANHAPTRALLEAIRTELPDRFFFNLGPGLVSTLGSEMADRAGGHVLEDGPRGSNGLRGGTAGRHRPAWTR